MVVKQKTCNRFREGTCEAWAERYGTVLYCPAARALYSPPGTCSHHPLYRIREKLEILKKSGVKLARYGGRLKDAAFVDRLYDAYGRVRAKRS